MSRRQNASQMKKADLEELQDPLPEVRRTRSGRTVRTPTALLESVPPVRTPSRRPRRSVQELPPVQEKPAAEPVQKPETVIEENVRTVEPEPAELPSDTAASVTTDAGGDAHLSRSAPTETAPTSSESAPPKNKKRRLEPSGKQNAAVPLGKPKSGRVWKDRNKQR